ncbi:MAG: hypothetical protein ACK462_11215, partial [Planctomyces sp.]
MALDFAAHDAAIVAARASSSVAQTSMWSVELPIFSGSFCSRATAEAAPGTDAHCAACGACPRAGVGAGRPAAFGVAAPAGGAWAMTLAAEPAASVPGGLSADAIS